MLEVSPSGSALYLTAADRSLIFLLNSEIACGGVLQNCCGDQTALLHSAGMVLPLYVGLGIQWEAERTKTALPHANGKENLKGEKKNHINPKKGVKDTSVPYRA